MKKAEAPIFLVGFMGSGKSTVGKALAFRLGRRLIDTDREIAKAAGRSIASVFKRVGERGFRERESRAIARACRARGAVVAVGGGAVTRRENVAAMRRSGTIVYLQAPLSVLRRRVGAGGTRPLWKCASSLYAARIPLYRRAGHFSVRSAAGTPAAIAERIAGRLP